MRKRAMGSGDSSQDNPLLRLWIRGQPPGVPLHHRLGAQACVILAIIIRSADVSGIYCNSKYSDVKTQPWIKAGSQRGSVLISNSISGQSLLEQAILQAPPSELIIGS